MISNKAVVQSLIQLLKGHGVSKIVISPGSRNAPLTLSFTSDPFFECFSIVDERSAGFFAMGMAQQCREPVVICCTSGSATLNFAPAVVEAYYQKIPLIVLTADRPVEWIDRGEGQSMRQSHVFNNYIRRSYDLIQESNDGDLLWHNEVLINRAIEESMIPVAGPTHINIPFRESLYGTEESPTFTSKIIQTSLAQPILPERLANRLAIRLQEAQKVLVLTGLLNQDEALARTISEFAENDNVLVVTETTSNLPNPKFIDTIDRFITSFSEAEKEAFQPDVLITLGEHLVSKKVKRLLRTFKPNEHWHISSSELYYDTFQSLTRNINISPKQFFRQMNQEEVGCESDYKERWFAYHLACKEKHTIFLEKAPFSDLLATKHILDRLPQDTILQMGNSSVVRYIQLFGTQEGISYFGNRGTSGIDGCTSTAVGAAHIHHGPTVLISGDLSFFYDSNALWNKYLSPSLKIIVLNNGGGGIFRIIDGPSTTSKPAEYFETQQDLSAKLLAEQFGLGYYFAKNEETLLGTLPGFFINNRASILEVFTPREVNDQVLKEYFRFITSKNLDFSG